MFDNVHSSLNAGYDRPQINNQVPESKASLDKDSLKKPPKMFMFICLCFLDHQLEYLKKCMMEHHNAFS